jgi:thioredoxin 1
VKRGEPVGSLLNLTDANFQSEVIDSKVPVLVDFWATWCGPCRMIAPSIEQLAQEYDGRVKVVKVDVDHAQKTAQGFGIRSIPTLLIFKDGKIADQLVGAVPKSAIEDKLKSVLS